MKSKLKIIILFLFITTLVSSVACSPGESVPTIVPVQAKITSVTGNPIIINSDNPEGLSIFLNMSIVEGDQIITTDNEEVTITIDETTETVISENSVILVSELSYFENGKQQSFRIIKGKIWSDIKEKLNVDSKYEIKTPTAVMGVRGTKFLVSYKENTNKIVVAKGIVSVSTTYNLEEKLVTEMKEVEFSESQTDITVKDIIPENLETFDIYKIYNSFNIDTLIDSESIPDAIENNTIVEDTTKEESNKENLDSENKDDYSQTKPLNTGLENSTNPPSDNISIIDNNDNENNPPKTDEKLVITVDKVDPIDISSYAISSVVAAETVRSQEIITLAQIMVSSLNNGDLKASLQYRLDLLNAEILVEIAEEEITQESVESAYTLVTPLHDSTQKTTLVQRLEYVQNSINKSLSSHSTSKKNTPSPEETTPETDPETDPETNPTTHSAIEIATEKVISAERSSLNMTTQNDINNTKLVYDDAYSSVDDLEDSSEKSNLLDRLAIVKSSIDAYTQIIQDAIDAATLEVVSAETSILTMTTQSHVNDAYSLYSVAKSSVDALVDSYERSALLDRLLIVENIIADMKTSLDAVDAATLKVISAESSSLNISTQNEFNEAISLYDHAYSSVLVLENLSERSNLLDRLTIVKNSIDNYAQSIQTEIETATALVLSAETSSLNMITQNDINNTNIVYTNAYSSVDALEDSSEKSNLVDRLAIVKSSIDDYAQIIQDAVDAATLEVVSAETSILTMTTQSHVDDAYSLYSVAKSSVDALKDLSERSNLLARLAIVKNSIDDYAQIIQDAIDAATLEVVSAETSILTMTTQSHVDDAYSLYSVAKSSVDALKDLSERSNLLARLAIVENSIDDYAQIIQDAIDAATLEVVSAETSILTMTTQIHIDNAYSLYSVAKSSVDALKDLSERTILLARLADVKNSIDTFQALLDPIKKATKDVSLAEQSTSDLESQSSINDSTALYLTAKSSVESLIESDDKDALINRLDLVKINIESAQSILDKLEELNDAKNKVSNAESAIEDLSSQSLINIADSLQVEAKDSVNLLSESSEKNSLLERLLVVTSKIDTAKEFLAAELSVTNAENTEDQDDVDNAQLLVDDLSDGELKNNLQTRLNNVQNIINLAATNILVSIAEESKTINSILDAQDAINALSSSSEKDALQLRIDILLESSDMQEFLNNTAKDLFKDAEHAIQDIADADEDYDFAEDVKEVIPYTYRAIEKIEDALLPIYMIIDNSDKEDRVDKLREWSFKLIEKTYKNFEDNDLEDYNKEIKESIQDTMDDVKEITEKVIRTYPSDEKIIKYIKDLNNTPTLDD